MLKVTALLLLASVPMAAAAECRSVGGHINGETTTATRTANIRGGSLLLSGVMDGEAMPQRTLPCTSLASGIWCEARFGPVGIVVMTNKNQMTETVTDLQSGAETAGFAYVCDRAFRL